MFILLNGYSIGNKYAHGNLTKGNCFWLKYDDDNNIHPWTTFNSFQLFLLLFFVALFCLYFASLNESFYLRFEITLLNL